MYTIFCHPDNVEILKARFSALPLKDRVLDLNLSIPVVPDRTVPKYRPRRWIFPAWPFVEFEPADEAWCVPLGIGRWSDPEPYFFGFDPDTPATAFRHGPVVRADGPVRYDRRDSWPGF